MNSETLFEKRTAHTRLPKWLCKKYVASEGVVNIKRSLKKHGVTTVCQEARCPNISECFSGKKITFMILGDICTRSCTFCATKKGVPESIKTTELESLLGIVKMLDLRYVIITSVTRDDLVDGGLHVYLDAVARLKGLNGEIKVEALTPDFRNVPDASRAIALSGLDVFGHNIETVKRLYPVIRPEADHEASLELLREVKDLSGGSKCTKTGFMLGLGEREEEVIELLRVLRDAGVDIVTIGQYLRPDRRCRDAHEYVLPEKFAYYKKIAEKNGIPHVSAGSFVRSSYRAENIFNDFINMKRGI